MYFQYNGKHYKELQGTALGSPVSVVVAEIVSQNIKEQALATYTRNYTSLITLLVNDTFTAVQKNQIAIFTNSLTDRTQTYSLPRRSRKMVQYLF